MPSSLSRYSSAPKTKRIFPMLWCIFEGRTNRARPSQPFLKNCQNGTVITHAWNSKIFGPNYFFWSALKVPKSVSGSVQVLITHWTYLLQILSQLCFQRVAFSGNYEIVPIFSDKTTIFKDLNYKADTGQHFHKSEKSARWRHRHKIIKTNLKTHISLLFTRP